MLLKTMLFKRESSRQESDELTEQLATLRRELVEKLWKNMVLIATIGVPISVSRAFYTGWLLPYSVHVSAGLLVLLVAYFRKRLSYHFLSALFVVLLWVIGLPGVITFGLAASSIWWLVLSCFVASMLYSVRVGVSVALATLAVLCGIGFGYITGRLTTNIDTITYQTQVSSWATLLIVTGAFAYFALSAIGTFNRSVLGLTARIKSQRDEIEVLAMYDELTGLPALRLTEDRVLRAIQSARPYSHKMALMFIDLDGFKSVNDNLGHEAGDFVLREVAARLTREIRAEDTAGRIGGDEFMVVLANLSGLEKIAEKRATEVASRIIASISIPIIYHEVPIRIGASVGIAIFPDHAQTPKELRKLADQAMYAAKKSGKYSYAFATAAGDGMQQLEQKKA